MASEPLPADQVPHASETIAMVISWLAKHHPGTTNGVITIPNSELVQDRGRVVFKESAQMDAVQIWLEPVNRGPDH